MQKLSVIVVGGVAAAALALGTTVGATAAQLITSKQIKDGTIQTADLAPSVRAQLKKAGTPGPRGATGATGAKGAPGADGQDGQDGADGAAGLEYRTYDYIIGGARAGHDGEAAPYTGAGDGSIATVACSSPTKVAIAGGVQFSGLHGDSMVTDGQETINDNWTVADSFPGRMDWETFKPKANRMDGWIIRLNSTSNAPATSVTAWAVCIDDTAAPPVS